jgi:O-antigen ligase
LNIFSQHIIGFDAFGHEPFDGRYNGLFESEAIAGSYIQKFFLVSILSILLLKIKKKTKFILTIIATNILGLGVLLSLDRMPFIIYLFSIIVLIALLKNFRLKFLISLILIIFIFQFSFNNYQPVKNRYMSLSNEFQLAKIKNIFSFYNKKEELSAKINENEDYNLSGDYLKIYVAAYKVFMENFFIGSGVKSFGFECNKLKENNKKNITCSTHPHNIYMEILVNQGIIGILIFIIFLFSLIKNNYLEELFSKNSSEEKLLIVFFFTILISELLPFRSYGSIFQTVNGSIFWFFLALISSKPFMKKN